MKSLLVLPFLATLPLLASMTSLTTAEPVAPKTLNVDTTHSSVFFKVLHNKVSYFYGRFNAFTGTIVVDGDKSSVEMTIDTTSIDTAAEGRDQHLSGPDFFDVKTHPEMTFKSSKVVVDEGENLEVTGDLTIRGKSKTITVKATKVGEGDGRRGKLVGYATTFTIKRSEFGVNYGLGMLGDDVEITLSLECQVRE